MNETLLNEDKEGILRGQNTSYSRLAYCEVCGINKAKYKCPACDIQTCCVDCVQIHKQELSCTGLRNRVKYKHIKDFSTLDLQNDYTLLEELGRASETLSRSRKSFQKNLSLRWYKLRFCARNKGITLQILPPLFNKHINNTTFHEWSSNKISWKVEWIFPQADNLKCVDNRIDESVIIKEALSKYLEVKECDPSLRQAMVPYHKIGLPGIRVLMRAEKVRGNKYMIVDLLGSLADFLQGKIIIEHPTFLVVLNESLHQYDLIKSDTETIAAEVKKSGFAVHSATSLKFFSDALSGNSEDSA